jgi:transcription elongation factor GreB
MGRWRPPQPIGSKYITVEGHQKLEQELKHLWRVKRPQVVQKVSEAAALGDRSENADYIYGKRQLAEIDRRVRFLRKRLEGMTIVDQNPSDLNKIFFSAWVELENEEGELVKYRVVGPDEFDDHPDYISMDSPFAKALMGKIVDDEVSVKAPSGVNDYFVNKIWYQ